MSDLTRRCFVHLYALCWNEERLLPFFFHHYDAFVTRYFIFDHDSTDRSRQLLKAHPQVALGKFEGRGDSYISSARDFYNHAWKESRGGADWVIICNIDEHLEHPDFAGLFDRARKSGATIFQSDLGREFIFEVLVARKLDGVACIAAQQQRRFGFGAVAGRGCGPLPVDPELIISEQARLGASVAWLGRSYGRACEKLTRSELVNEIRWIRSKFERPGNTEANFCTLQQQLGVWKRLEALAVAS